MGRRTRAAVSFVAFLMAVVVFRLVRHLMTSGGVVLAGDEPTYVAMAQVLLHGSVHILPAVQHDLAVRMFPVAYHANATALNTEHFIGPAGWISPFEPGIGLLLAPFVALLGATQGAVTGMVVWNAAGLVWLHQRTARLFGLNALSQVVFGLGFALPAVMIATGAIYPDLPAGILIALAGVELAAVEVERKVTVLGVATVTVAVSYLFWLQPKNLAPSMVLAVGWVVAIVWRLGHEHPLLVRAAVPLAGGVVSLAGFFVYNHHYYGDWTGYPEPFPHISREAVQITLGLLLDKDQGLFVQVPWALMGLIALVTFGRRRLSVAAAAGVLSFLAILFLNGTYVHNPYGGFSLAGRFMWTLIPISLPGLALLLERGQEIGRRLWPLALLAVAALAWQGRPILEHRHDYYNPMLVRYRQYPSWWPRLSGVLPQFLPTNSTFGKPVWATAVELASGAAAVMLVGVWAGPGLTILRRRPGRETPPPGTTQPI